MSKPMTPEDRVLLENAEHTLCRALELIRMITPEGWDRAWSCAALSDDWRAQDVSMLSDARLMALRGGPRFRPPVERKPYDQ